MTLRERCLKFYQQQGRNAMLRQGDPVEDLVAFVLAEKGRSADKRLEDSLPLVMYCPDEESRKELAAAFRETHPNSMTKKMP